MENNKPVDQIRIGRIKASVWENNGKGDTPRQTVTFSKLYKDADEKWQKCSSYGKEDLLLLAKVVDRAHSRLCEDTAE